MSFGPATATMQGVYPSMSFGPSNIDMASLGPSNGMLGLTPSRPINLGPSYPVQMGPSQPVGLGGSLPVELRPSQPVDLSQMMALGPSNYVGLRPSGGLYGGRDYQCAFPAPPPPRVYCQPAQFSTTDGRDYPLLVNSYGQSRPEFPQM